MKKLTVLKYLENLVSGKLKGDEYSPMIYPTPISQLLQMNIISVSSGKASVEIDADVKIHGNQQGTIHGGLLCELADAAIGTAHSTLLKEKETFASLELKINFLHPVWKGKLTANAKPIQSGRSISIYNCEIKRSDKKTVAFATSTVITLRKEQSPDNE